MPGRPGRRHPRHLAARPAPSRSGTVNVAVDLPVRVEIEPRPRGWIVVQDGARHEAGRREELAAREETALVGRVLDELDAPPCAVELASASPRGAGLGASSALTVALLAAVELLRAGRLERTPEERAALARDLEARLMGLPTGRQDHFPALLGGALVIQHQAGGEAVRRLDGRPRGARRAAARRLHRAEPLLGRQQLAGRAGRLDGDPAVTAGLDDIRDAALLAAAALLRQEWRELGSATAMEWRARRGLAEGISTPAIERLLASARERGAWGGKACGAGGGGCVAVLCPPDRRAEIAAAWTALGAAPLAAPPTPLGLETEVVSA